MYLVDENVYWTLANNWEYWNRNFFLRPQGSPPDNIIAKLVKTMISAANVDMVHKRMLSGEAALIMYRNALYSMMDGYYKLVSLV